MNEGYSRSLWLVVMFMAEVNPKSDNGGLDCPIPAKTVKNWTATAKGELIAYTDPKQGCARNCFVISALSAIAYVNSGRLSGSLANGYNFLHITVVNGVENYSQKNIKIDNKLATDSSATDFVYARSNNALKGWPMYWEKAYAKFIDDFIITDQSYPDSRDSTQPDIKAIFDSRSFSSLQALREVGRYKSFTSGQWGTFDGTGKPNDPSVATTSGTPPGTMIANHTYTLIKNDATNKKYKFRNPCDATTVDINYADLNSSKFASWGYVSNPY
jgi:hypothetical protein